MFKEYRDTQSNSFWVVIEVKSILEFLMQLCVVLANHIPSIKIILKKVSNT